MSIFSKKQYECPYCKNMGEFTMYESVNVTLDPSLRKKLFSGKLFEYKCPKCGKTSTILYGLLYHDMKNDLMIYLSPADIEKIIQDYNEMLASSPVRRILHRIIDNINSLKKRLLFCRQTIC